MKTKIIIGTSLFLTILLILLTVYPSSTKEISSSANFGRAIVSVLNKTDHTPIDNATVCVLETREYYQTGKLGATTPFSLPSKSNTNLNLSSPTKSWEEYTLLVYKNGFYPHIYYGLKIETNITKTGVVVELTERAIEDDFTYTESYDFPNSVWTEDVIDKYKK